MHNDVILTLFENWLTSSYRAEGTVKLDCGTCVIWGGACS